MELNNNNGTSRTWWGFFALKTIIFLICLLFLDNISPALEGYENPENTASKMKSQSTDASQKAQKEGMMKRMEHDAIAEWYINETEGLVVVKYRKEELSEDELRAKLIHA